MRRALPGLVLAAFACAAAADLYRWVDPETGSVKFSSLPPPWYGDPARERRMPKVEVIRSRAQGAPAHAPVRETPAAAMPSREPPPPAGATPGGRDVAALEDRRRELAAALRALGAQAPAAGPELAKRLETYAALAAELDRLDPQGAAARRAETEALLRRLASGTARPVP